MKKRTGPSFHIWGEILTVFKTFGLHFSLVGIDGTKHQSLFQATEESFWYAEKWGEVQKVSVQSLGN